MPKIRLWKKNRCQFNFAMSLIRLRSNDLYTNIFRDNKSNWKLTFTQPSKKLLYTTVSEHWYRITFDRTKFQPLDWNYIRLFYYTELFYTNPLQTFGLNCHQLISLRRDVFKTWSMEYNLPHCESLLDKHSNKYGAGFFNCIKI